MALPDDRSERIVGTQPRRYRITIPPPKPVTPEEIARRHANYERVLASREKMRPLGISTDELIHQARCEEDGIDY